MKYIFISFSRITSTTGGAHRVWNKSLKFTKENPTKNQPHNERLTTETIRKVKGW